MCVGRSVVVDHALDVAGRDWTKSEGSQVAKQRHRHTGFVAIGVREHDASLVGLHLEDRSEQRVQFRVHQNDVLAVVDRIQRHAGTGLDRAGYFEDHVDRAAAGQDSGSSVSTGTPRAIAASASWADLRGPTS